MATAPMACRLRVIIARHGERVDHVDPTWAETSDAPYDPPLTPIGVRMAQALGESIAHRTLHLVLSSPFTRCVQTACAATKGPVRIETGICEWLDADWYPDGDPLAKLPTPSEFRLAGLDVVEGDSLVSDVRFPEPSYFDGYDTRLAPGRRSKRVIDELKKLWRGGQLECDDDGTTTVLLVSHGGICPSLACACVDDVASQRRILGSYFNYCGVAEVLITDRDARLVRCGDTTHLPDDLRRGLLSAEYVLPRGDDD